MLYRLRNDFGVTGSVHMWHSSYFSNRSENLCRAHILILYILILVFLKARLLGHYVLCTILMLLVESNVIIMWNTIFVLMTSKFTWLLILVFLGMFNGHFLSSPGMWQTYSIGWLKTNLSWIRTKLNLLLLRLITIWKSLVTQSFSWQHFSIKVYSQHWCFFRQSYVYVWPCYPAVQIH